MWVKICANTNLDDAKMAAELGADAVGFVFAPSKRQVTMEQVAAMVPYLPASLETIGVFTSRDVQEIARVVRSTGLTGVQLHGGFDIGLARRLQQELGAGVAIIQTLHWLVNGEANNAAEVTVQLREIAGETAIGRVLVDSKTAGVSGGSGVRFDWSAARETFARSDARLIVAGGLTPENAADAAVALNPWGMDVASGVEAEPGKKDRQKLSNFIRNARKLRI